LAQIAARVDFGKRLSLDDPLTLVLVVDTHETEGEAGALNGRLMPKHSTRVRFPGTDISIDFIEILAAPDRVRAVLAMNHTFDPFGNAVSVEGAIDKFHSIELRVRVDDPRPTIHAHNRDDPIVAVGKGEDFLRPWIQVVLICYN